MKTKELVEKVNGIRRMNAKIVEEIIVISEDGMDFSFYSYPINGKSRGDGYSNFINLTSVYMKELFELLDLIDDYRQTPLTEREEPKLYNVKFPAITRDGKPIYLARHTGENDRIGVDWSSKGYIEKIKSQFAFTEQEIKDINASYWEFADEVEA